MNREYRQLRAKGFRAVDAFRAAKVRAEFDSRDDVRLVVKSDCEPYDASYVDTWTDMRESERERVKRDLAERIDREGCTGIVGEYRDANGEWIESDSCWGFIGDDWRDSGYDVDIMRCTMLTADDVAGVPF